MSESDTCAVVSRCLVKLTNFFSTVRELEGKGEVGCAKASTRNPKSNINEWQQTPSRTKRKKKSGTLPIFCPTFCQNCPHQGETKRTFGKKVIFLIRPPRSPCGRAARVARGNVVAKLQSRRFCVSAAYFFRHALSVSNIELNSSRSPY